jgi:hypothetical protein
MHRQAELSVAYAEFLTRVSDLIEQQQQSGGEEGRTRGGVQGVQGVDERGTERGEEGDSAASVVGAEFLPSAAAAAAAAAADACERRLCPLLQAACSDTRGGPVEWAEAARTFSDCLHEGL